MPLKVLMFGWELPPYNSGGLGVACNGLTQGLAANGLDITFVLPKRLPISVDHMRLVFADIPGFDQLRLTAYAKMLAAARSSGSIPDELNLAVQSYAQIAASIANQISHDLIHVHDWLCFPAGIVSSEVSHKPLITHVHATEYDRSGGSSINPDVYDIEKKGLTKAAKVIAVSNFTKTLLQKYYQAPNQKVTVVHNGIDPNEFSRDMTGNDLFAPLKVHGYKIVTYVGRLTLQKGVDYLIKAAEEVLKYRQKVVFLIIGSGDQEKQLINDVAIRGISDHVLFAGWLRGDLLKRTFRSSDLFVMPSVSEPFGLTALESVALGTPALISKQSGVAEALTHVLKVDFWDVSDMANKIVAVLDYSSLNRSLTENSPREVSSNTWSKAAEKTIEVYRQVLSKTK